ncbi:sulfotransferase domain-containing protein [Natronoglycomyces albus]|uniref:Sulfotransferase domain-containing protein n=2 Tax=Natronoglycomyces albus TaxID=2811108 RepID=A0A895XZE1_9ACTN|nr:sulfotransferase domain-containing protein [Natronoglycomyces albus]
MLPGLLICGGQRCGTTSLYRALASHPVVLKAILHKGVHYFDTSYHKGLDWYRAHFPTRATATRIGDHTGVSPVAFESSPYYLYHPRAAARIAKDLPGVKIIVLVRDPVERAYSHHAHEVARGFEDLDDFTEAIGAEGQRLKGEEARLRRDSGYYSFSHQHHGYIARGHYADYLDRLAEHIPREHILTLDSGDFFTDPEDTFDSVLRFLQLPWLGEIDFGQHNARGRPSPLPEELRLRLSEHYEPHDRRLVSWLGKAPSWRR